MHWQPCLPKELGTLRADRTESLACRRHSTCRILRVDVTERLVDMSDSGVPHLHCDILTPLDFVDAEQAQNDHPRVSLGEDDQLVLVLFHLTHPSQRIPTTVACPHIVILEIA